MKTPSFWYTSSPPPFFLRLLAWVYRLARLLHILITRPKRSPIPTICVGNITSGGAGKTPVVHALHQLIGSNKTIILSRGFGGNLSGPLNVQDTHTAQDVGDEALLHKKIGPIIVARHRLKGAQLAQKQGADMIIMDDGLQNRQITPDLNIIVIDGAIGFGNGFLIPAGPLREPPSKALARTDMMIIIGHDEKNIALQIPKNIPIFQANIKYNLSHIDLDHPYIAFAGIARPKKFFDALIENRINIRSMLDFPDHHHYTDQDIKSLIDLSDTQNLKLITTEKDWVKLPTSLQEKTITLPMQIQFSNPDHVKTFITHHLSRQKS